VRPIMTISEYARALPSRVSRSAWMAGSRRSAICSAAAMCIAVGKVSFDDWLWFTSSFGGIGRLPPDDVPLGCPNVPPPSWVARSAITSLAFMLVCVPDPVWNTIRGNSASSVPLITSCAAASITAPLSAGSWPRSRLARAAACFRIPSARITGRVKRKRSTPIGKFSRERSVWAPHKQSAGTWTSPSASASIRVADMARAPAGLASSRVAQRHGGGAAATPPPAPCADA
jgi:hypothetical protein